MRAIDEKVASDGGVNATILDKRLKAMENNFVTIVGTSASGPVTADYFGVHPERMAKRGKFWYKAQVWPVPQDFRMNDWRMWLCGKMVVWQGKPFRVKPFHELSGKELPNKQLVKDLDTKWKPIFRKMPEALGFQHPQDMVEETFDRSFDLCIVHSKSVVGYVWAKARNEKVVDGYTIGTWSRKVARSKIEKQGTPQDIANLPDTPRRNQQAERVQRCWWTNNEWAHKRARIGERVLTAYALTLQLMNKANHNK
jgi:hypothetical protein